jgi:hypothetical protein
MSKIWFSSDPIFDESWIQQNNWHGSLIACPKKCIAKDFQIHVIAIPKTTCKGVEAHYATLKVRHGPQKLKKFNFNTLFRPLSVKISSDFMQNDTSLSFKIIL